MSFLQPFATRLIAICYRLIKLNFSLYFNLHNFVDDLGRAVEELVTVITEQEIETTIESGASNQPIDVDADTNGTSVDDD